MVTAGALSVLPEDGDVPREASNESQTSTLLQCSLTAIGESVDERNDRSQKISIIDGTNKKESESVAISREDCQLVFRGLELKNSFFSLGWMSSEKKDRSVGGRCCHTVESVPALD